MSSSNMAEPTVTVCRQPQVGLGLMRNRANTLEKSEQIRPPVRRKRRTSLDFTAVGSRELRSGSVPPEAALHLPPPPSLPDPNPQPLPRMRRVTARPMLMLDNRNMPTSQPPDLPSNRASLDLSDLTPFGRCDSPKGESSVSVVVSGGRSATSASPSSSAITPNRNNSIRSNKWNWIWGSGRPMRGSSRESKDNSSDEKAPSSEKGEKAASSGSSSSTSAKHGSFLSRKRKSRHISLPDVTISSNDSSRSGSPVVFKVSLTSLFGGSSGGRKSPVRKSPGGSNLRRRSRSKDKIAAAKVSPKPQKRQNISEERVLSDSEFATEIVDDLRPVQYCQISPGDGGPVPLG